MRQNFNLFTADLPDGRQGKREKEIFADALCVNSASHFLCDELPGNKKALTDNSARALIEQGLFPIL